MIIVMCEVKGGMTGHRSAPLKDGKGIVVFPDKAAAQSEADKWNTRMNGPDARATFRYWVEEVADLSKWYASK
jgi:hypothetical protein